MAAMEGTICYGGENAVCDPTARRGKEATGPAGQNILQQQTRNELCGPWKISSAKKCYLKCCLCVRSGQ